MVLLIFEIAFPGFVAVSGVALAELSTFPVCTIPLYSEPVRQLSKWIIRRFGSWDMMINRGHIWKAFVLAASNLNALCHS